MRKEEALDLLEKGRSKEWNSYRRKHPGWSPDLSNTDLSKINFIPGEGPVFNLSNANLCGAILPESDHLYRKDIFSTRGIYVKLKGAIIDSATKFPDDFNPLHYGAEFVTAAERQLTVFISYAWVDKKLVLAVDQWLRSRGVRTKIDERDFFAGSRIRDEISRVMQDCDVVLIFYSERSSRPWTQFEQTLAGDLEIEAQKGGRRPPRIIYFMLDETPLPSVTERNRIAVVAKGKKFQDACEELYRGIVQIPKEVGEIDLSEWVDKVL
ncbi:MAG TPA: toll/interleukin-1 receptor domain-containing protein [Pyrinomonadaceae bacterium]|nr:toll/interleukin-1 receptor domain-containing protein [Pyrinomonadaceae bacterium]